MSEAPRVVTMRNHPRDLRIAHEAISIARGENSALVVSSRRDAKSDEREQRLLWNEVELVRATYPWPTLEISWREEQLTVAGTFTRIARFMPADAREDAAYAEAIRRIVERAQSQTNHGVTVDRGWLDLPGTGGKDIDDPTAPHSAKDERSTHLFAAISYVRDRLAKLAREHDASGQHGDALMFPIPRIAWNGDDVVFGRAAVGPQHPWNALEPSMDGFLFHFDDVVKLELVDPWP